MIDEQSSASEQDYASDRSAIGAGLFVLGDEMYEQDMKAQIYVSFA